VNNGQRSNYLLRFRKYLVFIVREL